MSSTSADTEREEEREDEWRGHVELLNKDGDGKREEL